MARVAVYGARGHTAQFVIRELARRGHTPLGIDRRMAAVDDDSALDRSLAGAAAVINCAGPFLDTARPLVAAAVRAGIHYLDVTAEQVTTQATLAVDANVCVVPAAGFYGGLADLLASSLAPVTADTIDVRIALDRWWPTAGTRITGQRNTAPRLIVTNGVRAPLVDPRSTRWQFPPPFDEQALQEVPFSEIITLSHHIRAREIHTHLNAIALADVRAPDTSPPRAVDERGRSAQRFVMEVAVDGRTARASGQDIYAVTAPIVVEAVERILTGRARRTGAAVLGELFDAADFLAALAPDINLG